MPASASTQPVRRSARISNLHQDPPPTATATPASKSHKVTTRSKNTSSAAKAKPKAAVATLKSKPAMKRATATKNPDPIRVASAKKAAVTKATPVPQTETGASASASEARVPESKLLSIVGIMLAKGCCPICFNTLDRPRALVNCGHVFCHPCLEAKFAAWGSGSAPAEAGLDDSPTEPAPHFIASLGSHKYRLDGFTDEEEAQIVDGVMDIALTWASSKSKNPPNEALLALVGAVARSNKKARVVKINTAGETITELTRELEDSPRTSDIESDSSPPVCPKCSVEVTCSPIRISALSTMAPHLAELDALLDEEVRSLPPTPAASDVDEDWFEFGLLPIRSKRAHSAVDSDPEDNHEEKLRKARAGKKAAVQDESSE